MIRKLLFCCVTLLGLHVLAANVVWDKITMREAGEGDPHPYNCPFLDVRAGCASSCIGFHSELTVANISSFEPCKSDAVTRFAGAVIYAAIGDIVDASILSSEKPFFMNEMQGSSEQRIEWTFLVKPNEPSYFALVFQDEEEAYQYRHGWRTEDPSIVAYGWVGLQATGDGNLFVVGSAIDLDGGPMIVGGGSATPEPSSGLLLLLGVGLLALRRVRVSRLKADESRVA